jgi:hypothetical protein
MLTNDHEFLIHTLARGHFGNLFPAKPINP